MLALGVLYTGHNISPRLDKQLVLELEIWVEALELPKQLPCGFCSSQAVPLDEDVQDNTAMLSTQDACWSRQETTVMCRRHRPWNNRRIAAVRLQQTIVEDVV